VDEVVCAEFSLEEQSGSNLSNQVGFLSEIPKARSRTPTMRTDQFTQLCRRFKQFCRKCMSQLIQNAGKLSLQVFG
jgi:hypothetical protein